MGSTGCRMLCELDGQHRHDVRAGSPRLRSERGGRPGYIAESRAGFATGWDSLELNSKRSEMQQMKA